MIIYTNPCSYLVTLTDTTNVTNPYTSSRGSIIWEIYKGNTWQVLGYTPLLGSLTVELCEGSFQIRSKYQIRLIQNCGGISPVVFETAYTTGVANLLDIDFQFEMPLISTCLYVNKPYTYNFTLNSNCSSTGVYKIYNNSNVLISTSNVPVIDLPTSGYYRLEVEVCNCCSCKKNSIYFHVCNDVQIIPTIDCLKPSLYNSKTTSLSYEVFESTPIVPPPSGSAIPYVNTLISSGSVSPNSSVVLNFETEGYYYVTYGNFRLDVPLFCKLNDCLNKLIESFMCKSNNCGCLTPTGTQDIDRLIRVKTLSELYYKGIQKTFNISFNVGTNLLDWNNNLLEKYTLQEIYDKAIEYCEPCNKSNDCNCK